MLHEGVSGLESNESILKILGGDLRRAVNTLYVQLDSWNLNLSPFVTPLSDGLTDGVSFDGRLEFRLQFRFETA
jgi:hypothetical protein